MLPHFSDSWIFFQKMDDLRRQCQVGIFGGVKETTAGVGWARVKKTIRFFTAMGA